MRQRKKQGLQPFCGGKILCMPTNLNALIRYKTINSCLLGGRRKWTIEELIIACSEALAEHRGRYEQVSERTIRDDIRIMRSDILGFNAPIVQEKGLYFYSDPVYSVMGIHITDSGLAGQIINLLQELRKQVNSPELETVLGKLLLLNVKEVNSNIQKQVLEEKDFSGKVSASTKPLFSMQESHDYDHKINRAISYRVVSKHAEWGDVFGLI